MPNDLMNPPQMDAMISALERLAKDPTIPTERIALMFELAERREKTIHRRMFNYDMNAFQMKMQQVLRDKPNPAFHAKYATEEAIDRAARPIYTEFGFSIRFGTAPATQPGNIMVVCTVAHRGGHYEEHPLEGPVNSGSRGTTPIQAVGATVTYLKRALIRMVLNLVTADNAADDDGEGMRDGDKYKRWVDTFEDAVEKLTDSDAAKALLSRDSAMRMLTEIPSGPLRQRYHQLRADVEKHWMKPIENATTQEIEGL
jgi:ERF superfamily protein